jgi:indole-3-glycerol phosphate synthase
LDFLTRIIAEKRARLEESKRARTIEDLRAESLDARQGAKSHALCAALRPGMATNIIAEIKRASPSKGIIRMDINPSALARMYEAGGAVAISVLTEEDHFLGSLDDLRAVRAATGLPVLRKDFIFDDFQIYETAAAGADALLLIVAALDGRQLMHLRRVTEDDMGMDALLEVHTSEELGRALKAGGSLIGVNNRDLHTFDVALDTSVRLAGEIPGHCIAVSESGLGTGGDLRRLRGFGYSGFLIGESLMRSGDPEGDLRALREEAGNTEDIRNTSGVVSNRDS